MEKEFFVVLDTETTNSIDDPLAYDVGFAVVNDEGRVFEAYSFVVAEVFLDKELMENAYFKEKIPMYWEDIKAGRRTLAKLSTISRTLARTMKKYNTNIICAHNARFDYRSTNTTQRFLTSSKYRYFFPYGVEIWDTLKMARKAFNDSQYDEFCYNNNYITKNGRKRYTAEILYRFITNNIDFEESHTGLEDVLIEKEILAECLKRGVKDGKMW